MRINALTILSSIVVMGAPPVSAQPKPRDAVALPQFIAPEAQVQMTRKNVQTQPPADETRRAAEALSAKFSGDFGEGKEVAKVAAEPPGTTASIAADPPVEFAPSGRSAVLRSKKITAGEPVTKPPLQTVQRDEPSPTAGHRRRKSPGIARAKSRAAHADRMHRMPDDRRDNREAREATAVPGAATGWQTGIIGMLTNPAFWH